MSAQKIADQRVSNQRLNSNIASAQLAVEQPQSVPTAYSSGNRSFSNDQLGYLLYPFRLATRPALKQSVFVFAGRTTSTDLWSTAIFNLNGPSSSVPYDNYIVGGAYQRDFFHFNSGLLIGAEVGLADRFGHYRVCCSTIVYSDSMVHSVEFWSGLSLRHEGFLIANLFRWSPGVVFGLSMISNPIGQEAYHQNITTGTAKFLFYLALESAFSLPNMPETELVVRLHHRSGGYGTLGGIKEGNNANVVGIRHRF